MADLIERKDALDCLDSVDFDSYEDYSRTFDTIEDITSANRWITCSERLPEVGQFVLVYYPKWGSDAIQVGMLESDRLHFDICGEFCFPVNKVTHWMSLPEKPEVQENDD